MKLPEIWRNDAELWVDEPGQDAAKPGVVAAFAVAAAFVVIVAVVVGRFVHDDGGDVEAEAAARRWRRRGWRRKIDVTTQNLPFQINRRNQITKITFTNSEKK